MQLLLEIPYMGDDSVDLSGDVGSVGRILMHAPDEAAAEPDLHIPGAPCDPISDPAKRAGTTAGATAGDTRVQTDCEAANDLADPSAWANGNADISVHGGAKSPDPVPARDPDSTGEAAGGKAKEQLASGSRRRGYGTAKRSSGVGGSGNEDSLEDDDMDDASDEYVESEEESEGGSDEGFEGPVGNKRKRRAGKVSAKLPTASFDGERGDDEANHAFMIDLKGVIFSAHVVQMPCSALVVHVGETQAKVWSSSCLSTLVHCRLSSNVVTMEGLHCPGTLCLLCAGICHGLQLLGSSHPVSY